jgi:hypothetical protein
MDVVVAPNVTDSKIYVSFWMGYLPLYFDGSKFGFFCFVESKVYKHKNKYPSRGIILHD